MAGASTQSSATKHGLGGLERELHATFQASRLPARQKQEHVLVSQIERACEDHTSPGRSFVMNPLVVLGPPGSGKSTVVAAWLAKRRAAEKRLLRQHPSLTPEFQFVHVVGCTRQSLLVRELLNRLVCELVAKFDLVEPRDFSASTLAWKLPGLLEQAGAKGDVLLVIDGLNRLRNDAGEVNLSWLPQAFPPNVRVVVSTCLPHGMRLPDASSMLLDDDPVVLEGHAAELRRNQRRVVAELRRRRWHVASVANDASAKHSIMRTYLEWHEQEPDSDDETHLSESAFLTQHEGSVETATSTLAKHSHTVKRNGTRTQARLDLFDAQHRALEAAPTSSLTLATFLRALVWSAARGFDVWSLQEAWLQTEEASTAEQLFEHILDTWEAGHDADVEQKERARRNAGRAGVLVGRDLKRRQALVEESSESEAESTDSEGPAAADRNSMSGRFASDHPATNGSRRSLDIDEVVRPKTVMRMKGEATLCNAQAIASQKWAKVQHGSSRRLDHVLEVASLVTARLLANGLDAFMDGVDDLGDDTEEAPVAVSIPMGGDNSSGGNASTQSPPISVREAQCEASPVSSPAPASEEVSASITQEEEVLQQSDDDYGEDSYEDDYGDEFDDFDDEDAGFSQDLNIEDYLKKIFAAADGDGNGEISTQEAVRAVKADAEFAAMLGFDAAIQVKRSDYTKDQLEMALDALDTDASGTVSWEEFRNAFLPPSDDEFEEASSTAPADADPFALTRDDFESEEEDPFAAYLKDYEAYLQQVFEYADANSDGELSYAELVVALKDPDFAEVAVDAMGFVDSGVSREEFAAQFLDACDWDGNQVMQWDEFRDAALESALEAMHEARMEGALREVFERIDADGSGAITIGEAVVGLREDADFADILGFWSTHHVNREDGSLDHVLDQLRAMDANSDGAISWDEFRASVFGAPEPVREQETEPLPDYLLGGADKVPGLGTLLGDALALLCVARYGLLEDELWALLGDLDRERREDLEQYEKRLAELERERVQEDTHDLRAKSILEESKKDESDDDLDDLEAFLSEDAVGGTQPTVFAPEVVGELPKMLAALGVLWDATERCLVLPLESEALRMVVHRRYVSPGAERVRISLLKEREAFEKERNSLWGQAASHCETNDTSLTEDEAARGGDWWHARVAAYFAGLRPSRRRAEELPWHLKECRQWTPLCEALSDVHTFEVMFLGPPQMRMELAGYWKLLVDGPLFLSEAAEHAQAIAQAGLSPNQIILSNLDTVHALGLIESRAKRDVYEDQTACFDVVDCYTKSIDLWHSEEKPSLHRLQEMLHRVGDFLVTFSESVDPAPLFLRGNLNWDRLVGLGVPKPTPCKTLEGAPSIIPDDSSYSSNLEASVGLGCADDATVNSLEFLLQGAGVPNAGLVQRDRTQNLYHFWRWTWLQFPWLALANGAAVSWAVGNSYRGVPDDETVGDDGAEETLPSQVPLDTEVGLLAIKAAKRACATLSGSSYKRSWELKRKDPTGPAVARLSSAQFRSRAAPPPLRDAPLSLRDGGFRSMARLAAGVDMDAAMGPLRLGQEEYGSIAEEDSCFSEDATSPDDRTLNTTDRINGQTARGNPLTADLTLAKLHRTKSPEARKMVRLRRVANRLLPRRMRIGPTYGGGSDIHLEGGNGPFSSSALRYQRRGTRFPSAEATIKEAADARAKKLDTHTIKSLKRFGGVTEPNDLIGQMKLREIERMTETVARNCRDISSLNHTSAIFPTSPFDLVLAQANAQLSSLRTECDRLTAARREKRRQLEKDEVEIADMNRANSFCLTQLERGEETLGILDDRLTNVRCALAEAAALGAVYGEIIRAAQEDRPTGCAQRMEVVERQLKLAEVQAQDLIEQRRKLYGGIEDDAAKRTPKLLREKQKWEAMTAVTRERTRLVLFSVNELNEKIEAAIERMAPVEEVEELPYESDDEDHAQDVMIKLSTVRQFKHTLEHGSAMEHLIGLQDLMQSLKIAAGATDPDGVAHKLRTARELSASLETQHHQAVAKSAHLKTQLERHQQVINDMRMTGESAPSTDDDAGTVASHVTLDLFQADLDLEHARRRCTESRKDVASVSTGVLHVAKLLEAYTRRTPEDDPVKALALDRSTVRDVERGDLPPLDRIDTDRAAVVKLLGRCEVTIVSIREALAISKQLADDDEEELRMDEVTAAKRGHSLEGPVRLHKTQPLDHHDDYDFMHKHCDPSVRTRTRRAVEKDVTRAARRRENSDRAAERNESKLVEVNEAPAALIVKRAMGKKPVQDALRQANMLSRLKQGNRAPLGMAVAEALRTTKDQADAEASASKHRKPRQLGLSTPNLQLTTRGLVKAQAAEVQREREREKLEAARRKRLLEEAEMA